VRFTRFTRCETSLAGRFPPLSFSAALTESGREAGGTTSPEGVGGGFDAILGRFCESNWGGDEDGRGRVRRIYGNGRGEKGREERRERAPQAFAFVSTPNKMPFVPSLSALTGLDADTFPYLQAVVGFSLLVYVFETYLDVRQLALYDTKSRPKELEPLISQERFAASQAYNKEKMRFHLVKSFVSQALSLAELCIFLSPWIWRNIPIWFSVGLSSEVARSVLFVMVIILKDTIISLPWSWYSTFVVEDRHGFRTEEMTLKLWLTDTVKNLVLSAVIGAPVVAALVVLIRWGGAHFYLYVWTFLFVFQMVMMFIYPTFIQPCYNKVTGFKKSQQ
jgi:hypothetical protein